MDLMLQALKFGAESVCLCKKNPASKVDFEVPDEVELKEGGIAAFEGNRKVAFLNARDGVEEEEVSIYMHIAPHFLVI